jgi:uncharacterized protein YkwD
MKRFSSYIILLTLAFACGRGFKELGKGPAAQQDAYTVEELRSLKEEIFQRINEYRARRGLLPLVYSPIIEEIAQSHSVSMGKNRRPFGHRGLRLRCRRMVDHLGGGEACGEVVGLGRNSSEELFSGWLGLPLHRREIETPFYTHVGLGAFAGVDGRVYVTGLFLQFQ